MVGERTTGAATSCARGAGPSVSSATVEATRNVGLVTDMRVLELCGGRRGEVKCPKHGNSKRLSDLTVESDRRTMARSDHGFFRTSGFPSGGDTASTGVKTRGMHAEPHRLVNPVENKVTADTQLALAA